jgi:hypothetical protein
VESATVSTIREDGKMFRSPEAAEARRKYEALFGPLPDDMIIGIREVATNLPPIIAMHLSRQEVYLILISVFEEIIQTSGEVEVT